MKYKSFGSLLENRGIGFQPVFFIEESQAGTLCHEDLQQAVNSEPTATGLVNERVQSEKWLVQLLVLGDVPFGQIEAGAQAVPLHVAEPFVISPEFLGDPQEHVRLFAVEQPVER